MMKQFAIHLLLSILAVGLSILSTVLAWGYMMEAASFWMQLGAGAVFILNPVCVLLLAVALFCKRGKKVPAEPKKETAKELAEKKETKA